MPETLWHVDASIARLSLPRLSGLVDPRQPHRGLHDVKVDSSWLREAEMLGVTLAPRGATPTSPADCYVRVGDLVASYADVPQAEMRTEVYWRSDAHPAQPALGLVELMISVQTNLLDCRPQLATRSQLLALEVLELVNAARSEFTPVPTLPLGQQYRLPDDRPRCLLLRLAGTDLSYAEMVHPADPGQSEIRRIADEKTAAGHYELRHHLFAAGLEKGVILRARVLGVLLQRAGDQAAATQHFQAFAAAVPPLTR
jgi:hypothetical protein